MALQSRPDGEIRRPPARVTVNSAAVHLAGALGVPTWLALSADSDWRSIAGHEDSPWYPTVRIFRQKELQKWDEVFTRIAETLAKPRPNCDG